MSCAGETSHATVDPAVLVIERTIAAPVDRVFAAWLDPGTLAMWLSPTGIAEAEVDARVGGRFRVVMVGTDAMPAPPDGLEHTGEYLAIEPDRRLAFTWSSPYTGPHPTHVTIHLEPVGHATRLVLTHERLPAEVVASHRGGWGSILDSLARFLEGA